VVIKYGSDTVAEPETANQQNPALISRLQKIAILTVVAKLQSNTVTCKLQPHTHKGQI
jgi:hypothetical protein